MLPDTCVCCADRRRPTRLPPGPAQWLLRTPAGCVLVYWLTRWCARVCRVRLAPSELPRVSPERVLLNEGLPGKELHGQMIWGKNRV